MQAPPPTPKETLGTTILALRFSDGIILAADSRSTRGTYIADRLSNKIEQLHDQIFCLRSGTSSDSQTVCKYVRSNLAQHQLELARPPHVRTAARMVQTLLYDYKDQLASSLILAGFDPYAGFQIYSLPRGGAAFQLPFAVGGSGSAYIQAYLEEAFRPELPLPAAKELAINAVSHAIAKDSSSGGSIRLLTLFPDRSCREYVEFNNGVRRK